MKKKGRGVRSVEKSKVVNSKSGRKGRRHRVLDSEEDGGDTMMARSVSKAGITSEPKKCAFFPRYTG